MESYLCGSVSRHLPNPWSARISGVPREDVDWAERVRLELEEGRIEGSGGKVAEG